jgi:DNA polymerase-3 subunit alpha
MRQHGKGLIAILPQFEGEVSNALQGGNKSKAKVMVDEYREIFGDKNVFLEIVHHPELGEDARTEALVEFGRETKTPLLAAHDIRYLSPEDARARATLLSIAGHPLTNEEEDFSFVSSETMAEYFSDVSEALENAIEVSERCNLRLELGTWVFPKINLPKSKSADEELRRIVYEGFEKRGAEKNPANLERVEYELKIIRDKGYAAYFLVVADLMRYARERGILSNIRGSVSGSMVTYLSGITNIDPIKYEIPFERFLNPDRPSPPDIDMDFADDRRDEVIDYVRKLYGEDKVAQIGTFGTMMARAAVRDVSRALGYSYGEGDRIAKLIPIGSQGFPMTIDHAFEIVPELKKIYDDEDSVRDIIDMAKKIEGNARRASALPIARSPDGVPGREGREPGRRADRSAAKRRAQIATRASSAALLGRAAIRRARIMRRAGFQ